MALAVSVARVVMAALEAKAVPVELVLPVVPVLARRDSLEAAEGLAGSVEMLLQSEMVELVALVVPVAMAVLLVMVVMVARVELL